MKNIIVHNKFIKKTHHNLFLVFFHYKVKDNKQNTVTDYFDISINPTYIEAKYEYLNNVVSVRHLETYCTKESFREFPINKDFWQYLPKEFLNWLKT